MKKTTFTSTEIERIRSLNEKLLKEEERIKVFYNQYLKPFHEQLHSQQIIDDINVNSRLLVFTNNAACNQRHNVVEGNSIAEISWWCPSILIDDVNDIDDDNWNELRGLNSEHPLSKLPFCYTMHVLAFDTTELEWKDLLEIDDVWLEFKVDYQFITHKELAARCKS